MRRRTKRLPSSRGLIYLVLVVLLVGARYIYNNYMTPTERQGATTLPHFAGEETPAESSAEAPAENATASHRKAKRTGWAELPAEVVDQDLYYAYHTISEEGSHDTRRNYTTCFSRELRCPVWVAAPMHRSYTGDIQRTDSYQPDPKLPTNIQPQLSRSYGGAYSRGHLLGSAERTSSREANIQTFYVSNIAPQLREGFNAWGGAWNNLEAFADKQVCADTLYVVTGCLFTEYEDTDGTIIKPTTLSNRNDSQRVGVPTAYYKALLRTRSGRSGKSVRECKAQELKCAAFIVGHRSAQGRKPSAEEMISIEELERLTGFKFFTNVKNAPKHEANAKDWGLQ